MTTAVITAAPQEFANLLKNNCNPHILIPEIANKLGSDEAIVMQQVHYWLLRSNNFFKGKMWTYNTFNDWTDQFSYWSLSKIKRIFRKLEKNKLLISYKKNSSMYDHTKWYTINYKKLTTLLTNNTRRISKDKKNLSKIKMASRLGQNGTFLITNPSSSNINSLSNKKDKTHLKAKQTLFSDLEEEVCEKMINSWNGLITDNELKIDLSNGNKKKLLCLWIQVFNQDEEQWRKYCQKIKENKFLMGSKKPGFKAYTGWLLQVNIAKNILSGKYDDKEAACKNKKENSLVYSATDAARELTYKKLAENEEKLKNIRIEVIAEELAFKELEKNWSESDEEKAMLLFEKYMKDSREGGHEEIDMCRGSFLNKGWDSLSVKLAYKGFKIKHFLNKKFEDFIDEAKKLLSVEEYEQLFAS